MPIKLDMGRAWNDATALLMANRQVLLIVAAVFFFLPSAVGSLLMPAPEALMQMEAEANPDPEMVLQQLGAFYADVWWIMALQTVIQAVGMLGIFALLTDRSRPTVGQALGFGLKAFLPYLGAQILMTLIMCAVLGILIGLGALINVGVAVLLGLLGLVAVVYLAMKFSLASPVIAIEQQMNPVIALQRSWQLTKGNSLRLFAFFMLLGIVLVVIAAVFGMVAGLFALLGEDAGLMANALVGGLISMAFVTVMIAVLTAVHRQLSGQTSGAVTETFE